MNAQQAIKIIERLSPERRAEVFDFIEFISQRAGITESAPRPPLRDEPALGLWAGREEMDDSVMWVQELRRREWRG